MNEAVAAVPALRIRGLVKRFGPTAAVDGVDLDVPPGEIFALLGPNGAGKTTLIHCVAGLARPGAGRIEVFGQDTVRAFRATRRLVGLVPQEIVFDPFFTPFEALVIQMGLMGVRPDPAYADELLRTFALSAQRDAYTRTLSGGMKRRLLVAKALVHRPKLLFLDEPTAGVDVELRKELWAEVRKLRAAGTTIILTTHYLEEAEQLADRIGVIHRGRLVLVERREALLARHREGEVSITLAAPLEAPPPGLPPGARLVAPGRLVVPFTGPDELVDALTAVKRAAPLADVRVKQVTLEDVFVDLIAAAEGRR